MGKQRQKLLEMCRETLCLMGSKCERTELLNSTKINSSVDESGVAGPEVEKDSNIISSTSRALQTSSTQGTPDVI